MADLKIEYWPIDRLVFYARNPRKNEHAVPKMASLIKEFGFKVPVVARSDGSVVDGHLRLMAARHLGMETVPVVLADEWTEAQVKAFRIAVNKSAELAEWDTSLLALEIEDLKELDFDLELTGFELSELDEILGAGEQAGTEGQTDPDAVPEAQEEPVSRLGDVWLLGRHRLMCGDSTDAGSVALLMNGEKADLTLTDPPYGVNAVNSKARRGTTTAGALPLLAFTRPLLVTILPRRRESPTRSQGTPARRKSFSVAITSRIFCRLRAAGTSGTRASRTAPRSPSASLHG